MIWHIIALFIAASVGLIFGALLSTGKREDECMACMQRRSEECSACKQMGRAKDF